MEDQFLKHFEQEMTFIRAMANGFAKEHPKVASRLQIEPDKCEDPYTERLFQAAAFINAGLHQKIDDDFPEITETLLNMAYPGFLSPMPSMTIVRFEPTEAVSSSGYTIEKNTVLHTGPIENTGCRFSTVYPVTLWPLKITSVTTAEPKIPDANARETLTIRLETTGGQGFASVRCKSLRFFLNGEKAHYLYELIFSALCRVECEWTDHEGPKRIVVNTDDIVPVGFGPHESMIPPKTRLAEDHTALFDFFNYPAKFLFFEIRNINRSFPRTTSTAVDIVFYLKRKVEQDLAIDDFLLYAVPAINLFPEPAEPIDTEEGQGEYKVVAANRENKVMEVHSIDRVSSTLTRNKEFFWSTIRRNGDTYLTFRDGEPGKDKLEVHTFCTNRNLPERLGFPAILETSLSGPIDRIITLAKPTQERPGLKASSHWQIISHLTPRYTAISEGGEEILKEILRLYNFDNSPAAEQIIDGIASIKSEHITKPIMGALKRGLQITICFNEENYPDGNLLLFTSALEHYLARYVSVNSFTRLVVKTLNNNEPLKSWKPREGTRPLI